MDEKKLEYFKMVAEKLYKTLRHRFYQKKKNIDVYLTKEDIYHELIVKYLETGDESYAERKVVEKCLDMLKEVAVLRSFGDLNLLEAWIDTERSKATGSRKAKGNDE